MLNKIQKSYLAGLMLGDGSLSEFSGKSKKSRLKIGRNVNDLDFLQKQYNVFKNFCKSGVKFISPYDNRTNKCYHRCYLQTAVHEDFGKFREKWYPNKVKIVPRDLKLNDTIIYQWFCDDGCMIIKNNNVNLVTKFATHSFEKEDVEFLRNLLNNYLKSSFRISRENQKNGKVKYFIEGSTNSSKLLASKIDYMFNDNIMIRKAKWRLV